LPAAYGFLLVTALEVKETGVVPSEFGNTNNVAEYYALIKGLEKAIKLGISNLRIVGDSQIIIYQVTGKYRCKSAHLKPLLSRVKELLNLIPEYKIEWLERNSNKADKYSRLI
jgi:ribonuclease HI